METINYISLKLKPPVNTVYVQKVELRSVKDIFIPNIKKTHKTEEFGRVIFANDQSLIGKIITIDPWRTTPVFLSGKEYVRISSEDGFTEVEIEEGDQDAKRP